jgi:hypothetical protein
VRSSLSSRSERVGAVGLSLTLCLGLAACVGQLGDAPSDSTAQALDCEGIQPGSSPIRRLTRTEYNNTVRDLLGDTSGPADDFVAEEVSLGFDNQGAALVVSRLLAEQYMSAAEAISARATRDLGALVPCGAMDDDDACAFAFIRRFAKRAFRRPVAADTEDRLRRLFEFGRDEYDFETGIQLVIQAVLQAPQFLYRVEVGLPNPVAPGVVRLDAYEMASRLSYMLWNTMPDEELFAAADADQLDTPARIALQARRMLDDPRARRAVANFHVQWLGLRDIASTTKTAYPRFDPAYLDLWKRETEAFLDHVVFDGEGDLATLFNAPYSMQNQELAAFYGVRGPKGDAFERVELDPAQRAGFLTHASILAVTSKPDQTSPIHRGKFVRERLLCQSLPPPPNNIVIVAPDLDPDLTTRERFAQHAEDAFCAGCHRLMDPIGFGFEHYDGIGSYRSRENGLPIDASGEILGSRDADGPFDGAIELAEKLAESDQVRECVATQWFRFAYGRGEQEEDRCAMAEVQAAFAASGYDIRSLLVALTQTEAFRFKRSGAGGGS